MPEADSELQLCCVPGSTLNHITANLGLCQWRQVPQHLPCLCSLPDAWHLGHSRSVGSLPTLENERGCLDSGFLQMVLRPRPSKGAVWETGALLSFSQGWVCFGYQFFPPFPLGQILLDTSDRQSHNRYKPKLPSWLFEF